MKRFRAPSFSRLVSVEVIKLAVAAEKGSNLVTSVTTARLRVVRRRRRRQHARVAHVERLRVAVVVLVGVVGVLVVVVVTLLARVVDSALLKLLRWRHG